MKVHLTKRLEEVAKFVSNDAILADIGSDHAFLPCYLVQEKRISKAYAGEVIVGPYNQSKKSVEEYSLQDYVFPILSDGLENIPNDTTEITIAGMGAYTILEILNAYPDKVKSYNKIILQANSHMELIREYISNANYSIIDESIVYDKGKYYEICVFNTNMGRKLSEDEILYGPVLLDKQSDTFIKYYEYLINLKENVLTNLNSDHSKYASLTSEIQKLRSILKR
ncbi:MAG: SAM-dependent methyltransferase [Erysipelotrichales bacterium]|nr:SAM-dependent methyltransferase [Erysipelotrichales bacterium]